MIQNDGGEGSRAALEVLLFRDAVLKLLVDRGGERKDIAVVLREPELVAYEAQCSKIREKGVRKREKGEGGIGKIK